MPLPLLVLQYEKCNVKLCDCNQREAEGKVPVLCLVAEKVHSQSSADCTAENGEEKQPRLRYAVGVRLGLCLVCAHHGK